MSNITAELSKLHVLTGAEFSRQVERIALMKEFHLMEGETRIYIVGGERSGDYNNLLNAARKAVAHGYRVYVLPNPRSIRTADFIFERKGTYRVYDLKTIHGNASVLNRLKDSVGQTNRVLLNIRSKYDARLLSLEIKAYFEFSKEILEVLVFKGNKMISVRRNLAESKQFVIRFRKEYEK